MRRSEETAVLSLLHAGPGRKLRTGVAAHAFGQPRVYFLLCGLGGSLGWLYVYDPPALTIQVLVLFLKKSEAKKAVVILQC